MNAPLRIDLELDRLRCYLLEWAGRQREQRMKLGFPESTLAKFMKSSSPWASELLEESDSWAMGVIDAAIDDLLSLNDGTLMRASVRARYLSEGLDKQSMRIRCFKGGELVTLTPEECDALADRAEISLITLTKRRGLPL